MTLEVIINSLRVLKDYDVDSDSLYRLIDVYRYLQDDGIECQELHQAIKFKRDAEYEDAEESLEDAIDYLEKLGSQVVEKVVVGVSEKVSKKM